MKTKLLVGLMLAMLVGAGCVRTVSDRTTGGIPFVKDRVEGRYNRPVGQINEAGKAVVSSMGTLLNEGTTYETANGQTNAVKTIHGKINQRNVWIRVETVEPNVSAIIVQTRTPGGVADLDLAHEIEKQVALKLQSMGQ